MEYLFGILALIGAGVGAVVLWHSLFISDRIEFVPGIIGTFLFAGSITGLVYIF